MSAMKAKEKAMKDEKEEERQVDLHARKIRAHSAECKFPEAHTSDQRQESGESREGTL